MVRTLLVRGMIVGVIAGVLGFGMAYIFGEPQVDRAIGFEERMAKAEAAAAAPAADAGTDTNNSMAAMPGMDAGQGGGEEEELVSRPVQSTWGLLTATVVYGASFGGIFALVYAFALGRFTGVSPRGLAALLALAAFIAIVVAPDSSIRPIRPPSAIPTRSDRAPASIWR